MGNQKANDDIYKMLSESGYSDKAIQYFDKKRTSVLLRMRIRLWT